MSEDYTLGLLEVSRHGASDRAPQYAIHPENDYDCPDIAIVKGVNARANAARLVHCWNCHDELLKALQFMVEVFNVSESPDEMQAFLAVENARAQISKATTPTK